MRLKNATPSCTGSQKKIEGRKKGTSPYDYDKESLGLQSKIRVLEINESRLFQMSAAFEIIPVLYAQVPGALSSSCRWKLRARNYINLFRFTASFGPGHAQRSAHSSHAALTKTHASDFMPKELKLAALCCD